MAAMRYSGILCAALLCGCVGRESSVGSTGGTLAIASGGDPDALVPSLLQTTTAAEIVDMLYDRLADIGDSLNVVGDHGFTPRLADRWTWAKDSMSIAFHINPNAKWHDGQRVGSNDVRFTIASTKDSTLGSPTASVITNIDSVSTPDSATAVFWFHARSPEQFYDAVYQNPIIPEHVWKDISPSGWRASEAGKHPIGSGQYRFLRWIPRAVVELVKGGSFTFTLRADKAPQTVARFAQKARTGYYDNLTFHRVEDWLVQGGDPLGNGSGGEKVPAELNDLVFGVGAVGVARGQDPSVNNGSQFFVTKKDSQFLNSQDTNFGQVTAGMDVVNAIKIGDRMKTVRVE